MRSTARVWYLACFFQVWSTPKQIYCDMYKFVLWIQVGYIDFRLKYIFANIITR